MLALADDAALARLVIAAIAIPGRARPQLSDGAVEGLPARPRIVSERLISLRHRRHPMLLPRRPCKGPQPDRRRALELLASCRDGCTEAMMLAHGFTISQMVELVRAGLATPTAERVVAGSRKIEVARVRITDAGRRALAQCRA
jgi:hypothetical protein